ncbi:protocatechuate 3,4-dioxygenase subunit alpha [Actibacterium sp. 188UL27-1]|uniref:protocatechuate 3,4-dioxygenase subunit alpha n=1 Tax=Actibacterium sp. 188UL27-1 TaxID=2786961 RepID=UPI00195697E1|nr:protocatechuate 3,4-dioxygenase subunit alpha [Actibacterium sp. 188UL27-1]MBM7066196.1 protocatechuate 3,4-dioxygenase subunit alpha [Actibacterium sp. 188UL27-1]
MPGLADDLHETPSQTAGPYVHIGLTPDAAGISIYGGDLGGAIAGPASPGERIRVEGVIFDGTGTPITDALLEIWQADASGLYPKPGAQTDDDFRGWARAITDFTTGLWHFETVKPGPIVEGNGATQAPHINLWIVARGINIGLNTRIYFADEAQANESDPVLNMIEWGSRRATLMAHRHCDTPVYRFDIRLQGEDETVFFDV